MANAKKNTDVAGAERPAEEKPAAGASQETKRQPIMRFWVEDVSASVFAHEHLSGGQPRTYYSISFERSYTDRKGERRWTQWFAPESLGKVVTVAQQAAEYIHGLQYPQPVGAPGMK